VRSIDEGIEVLSGKLAGRWIPRDGYEHGSIHDLVDRGLRHFHERLRDAEDGHPEHKKPEPKAAKAPEKKRKPTINKPKKRRRRP
jgi:hypothetical protein